MKILLPLLNEMNDNMSKECKQLSLRVRELEEENATKDCILEQLDIKVSVDDDIEENAKRVADKVTKLVQGNGGDRDITEADSSYIQRAIKLSFATPNRLANAVEVAFSSACIASRLISPTVLRQANATLNADINMIVSKYPKVLRSPSAAKLKRSFEDIIEFSAANVQAKQIKKRPKGR